MKNSDKTTIFFKNAPSLISASTIAGVKEGDGPLGKYIGEIVKSDLYGEKTFEKAECKMLYTAISTAIKNADILSSNIDALISGDLLNQIISSNFSARELQIPYIGIYNACSTMSEGFALAATMVDGGYMDNVAVATGSHFATAERQYRYPLELGCVRPPQSQWTVTGAGSAIISTHKKDYPSVMSATFGTVTDYGVTDANNMGAAMAPAAMTTIVKHLKNIDKTADYYDLILTGDLGVLGSRILKKIAKDEGVDLYGNHVDCGEMIYNIDEKEFQGGSGAGCSAVVFNSYIYEKMLKKELNKVLFVATGALLSTVSTQQGESIPAVAHAVSIENAER